MNPFSVREKLAEPLRVAADHGVIVLFAPHGPVSLLHSPDRSSPV